MPFDLRDWASLDDKEAGQTITSLEYATAVSEEFAPAEEAASGQEVEKQSSASPVKTSKTSAGGTKKRPTRKRTRK